MDVIASLLSSVPKPLQAKAEYLRRSQIDDIQNDYFLQEEEIRMIKDGNHALLDNSMMYALIKSYPFFFIIDELISRLFWDSYKIDFYRQGFYLVLLLLSLYCLEITNSSILRLFIGVMLQIWLCACAGFKYIVIIRGNQTRGTSLKTIVSTMHNLSVNLNKLKHLWLHKSYKLIIVGVVYSWVSYIFQNKTSITGYFILFLSFHTNWFQTITAFI